MAPQMEIKKLAMIGCGSMGGGMALLFAENGVEVSLKDPSEKAMDTILSKAEKEPHVPKGVIKKYTDYESLCASLGTPKVFVFSLPHGTVGDSVLGDLLPFLEKGDIIIDAGNEHWQNTERRQGKCVTRGVRYIGMGVSGGYQAARAGPSMCPGADDESLDMVLPLLKKVCAKDKNGNPCVGKAGTGGAGHYVKMMHNGIEHGMMSAVAEAFGIMKNGLGMSDEEMGDVFEAWNKDGELRGTFLIWIGADICRTKDKSRNDEYVLDTVEDKVVQDITGEEGTGIWSNEETIRHHIPGPTLTTAHYLRLASADRGQRIRAQETMGTCFPPQKLELGDSEKKTFLEALQQSVYVSCLCSYIQGLNVIEQANRSNHWNIDFAAVLQIWRAGCIIQADYIADLLQPILAQHGKLDSINLLFQKSIMAELKDRFQQLRKVVVKAVEKDHVVPAMSATLEYVKYQVNTELPTSFYEAQLDYFGAHMYDRKGEEGTGAPTEGKYHYEWKPAHSSKVQG
ncbi:6-phosphogluconate dehydrogenase C-terminal domain-like protein [Saccharata proteae CBS 121410]|uniref:6-phosphogluconate dehydrogenase, decarboxylating n=1 Tax=Saccharata proteae CBS 121410 TaxID=1314787 RepID=A0A9P4I0P0_9PEZI|nr:6-phosphogluconate dehydrogenase C-terminal domain-like protein [Saccharata proteae CBS 121410]